MLVSKHWGFFVGGFLGFCKRYTFMHQLCLRPPSLDFPGFEPFRSGVLFEGDCVDALSELKRCRVGVHLVVTSPPYDDLRTYDGYDFDFESTARLLADVVVPGGVIVWIVNDMIDPKTRGESCTSFRQVLYFVDRCGLVLNDTMIWEKNGLKYPDKGNRYHQHFEFMFVLSRGVPKTFNPIADRRNVSVLSGREKKTKETWKLQRDGTVTRRKSPVVSAVGKRMNVWRIPEVGYERHPAAFPYALAADHVRSWSNPGDIVLDPFLGSGTTAHSADLLDRFWVGAECSTNYCTAVRKRMNRVQNRLGGHEVTDALIDKRRLLGLTMSPQK